MQLKAVLKRVGGEIVKEKITDTEVNLYLRIDPEQGGKWVDAITEFLLSAENKKFTADISKYFYAAGGGVRYLWRVVLRGEANEGLELFGRAILTASIPHTQELTSYPLVGRVEYTRDIASGKLKGPHDANQAQQIVAMAAFGGGA